MGLFSKIFGKKNDDKNTGGMEDYMNLVRVYFQATMASNVGITNLAALPDLRVFKTTLHVPTVNNKLGVGEKTACRKMMKEIYGTDDSFFKEIDQSVRKKLPQTAGCTGLSRAVPGLHTGLDDAYGQPYEVQASSAFDIQERSVQDDREDS